MLRPHMRTCLSCRARLREFRAHARAGGGPGAAGRAAWPCDGGGRYEAWSSQPSERRSTKVRAARRPLARCRGAGHRPEGRCGGGLGRRSGRRWHRDRRVREPPGPAPTRTSAAGGGSAGQGRGPGGTRASSGRRGPAQPSPRPSRRAHPHRSLHRRRHPIPPPSSPRAERRSPIRRRRHDRRRRTRFHRWALGGAAAARRAPAASVAP